jgi:hypothetical protein
MGIIVSVKATIHFSLCLQAVGEMGLMEFVPFDSGEALRKELGDRAPQSVRPLIGNPPDYELDGENCSRRRILCAGDSTHR